MVSGKDLISANAVAEYVAADLNTKNDLLDKYISIMNTGGAVNKYDLSDSDILEFIDEKCSSLIFANSTGGHLSTWTVYVDGITTSSAETLRNAVCKAAKKWGEANE
jgi:hypothetical protein